MTRSKQYYKILFDANYHSRSIEFHTGRDRVLVSSGKSLNHGIRLRSGLSQKDHDKKIEELFEDWHAQIKVFDLIPA